jgi:hypothetical protein
MRAGGRLLPGSRALCYLRGTKEPQSATGEFAMRIDPKEGSPAMDYTEHMKTYGLFCKVVAYTIIGVVGVMVLLALFVA